MNIINWNVDWASPRSVRGHTVQRELKRHKPDLICLTEAAANLLPSTGHVIESESDYGYGISQRRKVLIWSRTGFTSSTNLSPHGMPSGRFVSALIGDLRIIGVCIPWSRAHVSTGRRDRKPWEDHLAYLDALRRYIATLTQHPVCVVGDFNQTVPRSRAPITAFKALTHALRPLSILTAGRTTKPPMLDHLAASPGVTLEAWTELPILSDHLGWCAELRYPVP